MLQTIRDWITGWLAVVIVVLLIIPFAFWGINYYFDKSGEPVAALVNGEKITIREFQRTQQQLRQQLQSVSKDLPGRDEFIKEQALQGLINAELLRQVKVDLRMGVSEAAVRDVINKIQIFQGTDGFDNALYDRYISATGFTSSTFEARVRQDMSSEQLQSGIMESVIVPSSAVEKIAKLNNQTRDFSYLLVSYAGVKNDVEITDQEIQAHYDAEDKLYMEPEKVKLAYLDLSLENLEKNVNVTDEVLHDYYDNHGENYSVAEQRSIKQILFPIGEDATAEEQARIEAKAGEVEAFLKSGKTFADVRAKYVDETDVKMEISEYGFIAKKILDPALDEAAFSLKKGGFSEPIKTKSGLHIVMVDDIKGGQESTFEEAREKIEKDYRREEAEKLYFEKADQLATLAYEHPDTLENAADALELQIQTSDFITRSPSRDVPALLRDPKIISAAFSEEVLQNGNNSDVIELGNDRIVVLRVIEHEAAKKRPLDEVRNRIVDQIRLEKGSARTEEIGKEILAKLQKGVSKEDLAGEYSVEWKDAAGVKRDDVKVNRSVLRTAFALGHPRDGQPLYGDIGMGSGDHAIITLYAVHEPETVSDEEIRPVHDQLQKLTAQLDWTQFIKDLRDRSEIKVFNDRL